MLSKYLNPNILLSILLFFPACSTVERPNINPSININLGLAYLQENKPELAKYRLLLALKQAPHDELTQGALAYYLEKTGEFTQAEEHYLLAIRFAKHPGAAKNNYGTFLCRRGKYQTAIDYFLAAGQDLYYLNTANAYENAGRCALKIPDLKQAQKYFSKAIAVDPSRIAVIQRLVPRSSRGLSAGSSPSPSSRRQAPGRRQVIASLLTESAVK